MKWLGLFEKEEKIQIHGTSCNLDVLCGLLQKKLCYNEQEKDMAILYHKFIAINPKTGKRRSIEVKLCEFGELNGFSAMARTVGIPVALAAWKILEKEINAVGVMAPVDSSIYNPILKDLPIKFTWK